jgi:hypothetical protein
MIRASIGLVAIAVGASACISDAGDAGGSGSAAASVWNASVTALEFHTLGGFPPPPPPGAQCAYREARYRLTVATRTLDASRCKSNYLLDTRSVVLSEDQLHQLEPVFSKFTPIGSVQCPLDASSLTLQVTEPTVVTEYGYCGDHPRLIAFEHLSAAMTALEQLAGNLQ